MTRDYRLAPLLAARLLGIALLLLAATVLVLTVVVAVLDWSTWVAVVVAGLGLLPVGMVGWWATRRGWVVRFTDQGYRVRFVRGAGTRAARWKDVEDAVTTTVAGDPVVVLRLRDGRRTTIPVQLLAGDREEFVRELQRQLQAGHGLRPLGG